MSMIGNLRSGVKTPDGKGFDGHFLSAPSPFSSSSGLQRSSSSHSAEAGFSHQERRKLPQSSILNLTDTKLERVKKGRGGGREAKKVNKGGGGKKKMKYPANKRVRFGGGGGGGGGGVPTEDISQPYFHPYDMRRALRRNMRWFNSLTPGSQKLLPHNHLRSERNSHSSPRQSQPFPLPTRTLHSDPRVHTTLSSTHPTQSQSYPPSSITRSLRPSPTYRVSPGPQDAISQRRVLPNPPIVHRLLSRNTEVRTAIPHSARRR